MDDVKRVQNLSKVLKTHLMLFPDPEFKPFDEPDGVKYYKSDYLTLNGKNLNRYCRYKLHLNSLKLYLLPLLIF